MKLYFYWTNIPDYPFPKLDEVFDISILNCTD